MKLCYGMKAWGWWMCGLLGKSNKWFLGFSKVMSSVRPKELSDFLRNNPHMRLHIEREKSMREPTDEDYKAAIQYTKEAMTDKQRKLLTEYLGECWHIPTSYFTKDIICAGDICRKCGKRGNFYDGDLDNRTFTTQDDMMALYRRIAEKGEWDDFYYFAEKRWWNTDMAIFLKDAPSDSSFSQWLFCLSGDGYEDRSQMVAEFLKRRKE